MEVGVNVEGGPGDGADLQRTFAAERLALIEEITQELAGINGNMHLLTTNINRLADQGQSIDLLAERWQAIAATVTGLAAAVEQQQPAMPGVETAKGGGGAPS